MKANKDIIYMSIITALLIVFTFLNVYYYFKVQELSVLKIRFEKQVERNIWEL